MKLKFTKERSIERVTRIKYRHGHVSEVRVGTRQTPTSTYVRCRLQMHAKNIPGIRPFQCKKLVIPKIDHLSNIKTRLSINHKNRTYVLSRE